MTNTLITNATIINEMRCFEADILIKNERIEKIASKITANPTDNVIDASGLHLLPGMIDDQVHFRDPGLTHKGDFSTESAAAVAGGITSVMDMPNTSPKTTSQQAIEDKHLHVKGRSHCNYGFYLGATNDNIEEIKRIDNRLICGVKVFMGASTGNMLVDDETTLDNIFKTCPILVATHCEDTPTILAQEKAYRNKYGNNIPIEYHPIVRNREACLKSTQLAVSLAQKYSARLHVLHISTADEVQYLAEIKKQSPHISAEACVHFLWFNDSNYEQRGNLIKCNPAIKTAHDQETIIRGIRDRTLDVIATDHAPHLLKEKQADYFSAPSGLPLVQTAYPSLLTLVNQGILSLEQTIDQVTHQVADMFSVVDRGYIREGYYADIVLADMNTRYQPNNSDTLYKCGWTPYEGENFSASINSTWVNGALKWNNKKLLSNSSGKALCYKR